MLNIAKITKKIRYKTSGIILKYLTPKLYESIEHQTFRAEHIKFMKDINPINIRPSIEFMKHYFKDKSIIGLELGVKRGNNAKSILNNLNISKLYLVDFWKNYHYIPKNANKNYIHVIQEFKNDKRVEIIKGNSLEICKNFKDSLDFIYIDSNHIYNSLYNDIANWINKVKYNGIISGHDITVDNIKNINYFYYKQVYESVRDYCLNNGYIFYIQTPDWFFIKRE